jgi:hypothetical protein
MSAISDDEMGVVMDDIYRLIDNYDGPEWQASFRERYRSREALLKLVAVCIRQIALCSGSWDMERRRNGWLFDMGLAEKWIENNTSVI